MKISPKTLQVLFCAVSISFGGVVGYYWNGLFPKQLAELDSKQAMSLEYYFAPKSFSEIQNAKELLQALSTKFLAEAWRESTAGSDKKSSLIISNLTLIGRLEHGVRQFQGTEQQLIMVRDLLSALAREKLRSRWLDLYLLTLYQHPTHPLIGDLANKAIDAAKQEGRLDEVLRAFKLLVSIPIDFESKVRIAAASGHAQAFTPLEPEQINHEL
jgi:hypothetical protein